MIERTPIGFMAFIGSNREWILQHAGRLKVAGIEERELEGHRADIIADVKKLVEKYRKIFDWDVPDIDQAVADKLILSEVRKALGELEDKLLG